MNPYPRWATILLTLLAAGLGLLAGCTSTSAPTTSGGGSATAPQAPNTIVIDKFAYSPVPLVVAPGAKITIINQDLVAHTVTARDKSFNSGTIAMGDRGEITAPTKPGNYPYFCIFHEYMTGTLIVR